MKGVWESPANRGTYVGRVQLPRVSNATSHAETREGGGSEQPEEGVFRRVFSTPVAFNLRKHHRVDVALLEKGTHESAFHISARVVERKRVSAGPSTSDTPLTSTTHSR